MNDLFFYIVGTLNTPRAKHTVLAVTSNPLHPEDVAWSLYLFEPKNIEPERANVIIVKRGDPREDWFPPLKEAIKAEWSEEFGSYLPLWSDGDRVDLLDTYAGILIFRDGKLIGTEDSILMTVLPVE